jgi:cell division protein FtsL
MGALQSKFYEDEVTTFNKDQSAKIIEIRKRQCARDNAKKVAKERLKTLFITLVMLAVFSGMFAMVIYKNSLVNEKKYYIFSLKSEIKSLNTEIEELQTAVEHSTDIKTVEKIARETLNMQYPSSDQYVYINATNQFAVSEEIIAAQAESKEIVPLPEIEGNVNNAFETITALLKMK